MRKFNRALLLRQEVPIDKERITFNSMHEIDDMWIWFFYYIHNRLNFEHSEIWMWNGEYRVTEYRNDFVEKWYKEFPTKNLDFDFVFSRGGFSQYISVMQACSNAFKVYYGAVFKKRFNPEANGDTTKYDLILADSQKQYDELVNSGYNVHKFLKPACENVFLPLKREKKYDVVFIANARQKKFKGHEWFFNKMKDTGFKILWIGNVDGDLISLTRKLGLDIRYTGWIPRKDISDLACHAKVGVCCSEGDSCPRIIPEMLCMGIPIIIRETEHLHIWNDYLRDDFCCLVNDDCFADMLDWYIKYYESFEPREFYLKNFSLEISSNRLVEDIKKIAG